MLGVISEFNGPFTDVADSIDWVILRALVGDVLDKRWVANAELLLRLGVLFMPGARPLPERGEPEIQAARFIGVVEQTCGGPPPMVPSLDFDGAKLPPEWRTVSTSGTRANSDPHPGLAPFYATFTNVLADRWGKLPSIYTLDNHWNANVHPVAQRLGLDFSYGGEMVLRTADYRDDPAKYPPIPRPPAAWWPHLAALPPPENQPDEVKGIDWGVWQFTQSLPGDLYLTGSTGTVTANVAKPDTRARLLLAAA